MIGRRRREVVEAVENYAKKYLAYDPVTGLVTFTKSSSKNKIQAGDVVDTLGPYGYIRISLYVLGEKVDVQLHRLIWFMHHGHWPPRHIDHIDHVRTNNRICNLRCVDESENMKNTGIPRNNTSGHTGVTWNRLSGKWQAQYMKDGKMHYLGVFVDKEEAARVVAAARLASGFHRNHGIRNAAE